MRNDDFSTGCGIFLGISIAFIAGAWISSIVTNREIDDKWATQCVERGYAEWEVDSSGRTKFVWKEENE